MFFCWIPEDKKPSSSVLSIFEEELKLCFKFQRFPAQTVSKFNIAIVFLIFSMLLPAKKIVPINSGDKIT